MQEKQRILVADDEPEIREVLRMMLGSEGYEILEAGNAAEAVAQAEQVDLVILDIMMPGKSGIQACTEIRENTNVPILFLTAKSGEHDKVLGFSAGGDDYLVKPFSYMVFGGRRRLPGKAVFLYGAAVESKGADSEIQSLSGVRKEDRKACILPGYYH